MLKNPKRIRILFETIVLIFLIALQVFIIAVSSIDLERYRPEIMKSLNDSLGGGVCLGKIEFSLFPYFGVRGNDFFLLGDENTPTIRADEVVIGVYFVPLIAGNVIPKKLRVISPTVFFTIEQDERLVDKIFRVIGKAAPKEGERIPLKETLITRATIRVTDKRSSRPKEYILSLSNGSFKGNLKSGPIEYSLSLSPPGERGGTVKSSGKSLPEGGVSARVSVKGVSLDAVNIVLGDFGHLSIGGTISGTFHIDYSSNDTWSAYGRIEGTDVEVKGSSYYPNGAKIGEIGCAGGIRVTPQELSIRDLVVSRDSLEVRTNLTLKTVVHRSGTLDDLTVSADIDDLDFTRDIPLVPFGLLGSQVRGYVESLLVSGRLSAHVDIAGNPAWLGTKAARLSITGRTKDATLDLGGAVVRGVSADVSLIGDEITLTHVSFREPKGTIRELKWRIEKTFHAPYIRDLVVIADDAGFEDIKDILASEAINALPFLRPTEGIGRIRGAMVIEAPIATTPGIPEVIGSVGLSDWALDVPFFTKRPKPGSALLIFEKNRMIIPPTTVTYEESVLEGEGELTNFKKPRLVMSIRAPMLDLVELFGMGDETVRVDDLSCRLIFEEGYLLLEDLKSTLYGGKCSGSFGYVYTQTEPESLFYLNLTGEGADFGAFLGDTGISQDITGKTDFVLSLRSDPGDPELILKTLDGSAGITVRNGTIKRLSILSKLISLMKISNYLRLTLPKLDTQGIPFDSITGDFVIEDGKAKTENLFFDSRVMKVTLVGNYDLVKDDLDMIMGFQLLQTIDLIVNKIPVVGYILTGDDGNLFTTYFRVTGSLKDPKVTTMTLKGLGEGTLNIFERIFRFPLKGFIPR